MGTGLAAVMILEKHFPLVDKHKQPRGRSRALSPATRILVALPGAAGSQEQYPCGSLACRCPRVTLSLTDHAWTVLSPRSIGAVSPDSTPGHIPPARISPGAPPPSSP